MDIEEHLINKTYFQTTVDDTSKKYPVKALGTAFFHEQMSEGTGLSSIRFAQGEVYYHHKDMEAAIYKWDNVKDDLQPWARKNIGDAYYHLGWLNEAEKTYKAIRTDDTTLSMEVALQLLTLYSENNQPDKAHLYMEKALTINPDYPNVTEIARAFYEDRQEWMKAIELASSEAVRTESLHWFTTLNEYVRNGYTEEFEPKYFEQVLFSLYKLDQRKFSELMSSFWFYYHGGPFSLIWLKTMNNIISQIDVSQEGQWKEISQLYYQSYLQLMNGQYLIHSLKDLLPEVIDNWIKVTQEKSSLFPATAAFAWDEFFPNTLHPDTVKEAERLVLTRPDSAAKEKEMTDLLETILIWAEENEVNIGNKWNWLLSQIDKDNHNYLLVTGSDSSKILNSMLNEELFKDDGITAFIQNGEQPAMNEITDMGTQSVNDIDEITEEGLVDLTWPSTFLKELNASIVHTSLSNQRSTKYSSIASGVLYVIESNESLQNDSLKQLSDFLEKQPDIPVHFVINDIGGGFGSEEIKKIISEQFPSSRQLDVTSRNDTSQLHDFIRNQFHLTLNKGSQNKGSKLLSFIRSLIGYLLDQRVTKENRYKEKVAFNDEVRNKLKGLVNHLEDSKSEKSANLLQSYRVLKEEMKKKVGRDIPPLLREVADEIAEDGDFRQVHEELDKMMNLKIDRYVTRDLIPAFELSIKSWLKTSDDELTETQNYLNEMSESFNKVYEEERMNLQCDFQVLKDWKRDLSRMMNRVEVEHINIMNRLLPSQLILKSAGKLLGNMQQNKQMLYNQYQKHIKNNDFEYVSTTIIAQFFMEFDLFEKALKSDISMSFEEPILQVNECIDEADAEIAGAKENLETMKEHPDAFFDPLKIFEVRILQYEMIDEMSEGNVFH
ncbi:tetratricopeptide repeat protein [Salipaludibacillus sp. HK11]|uniref:tetratricopeptide repeat protein n=1 Tax=Salipaludibacillus sp. HK11 TaxID=3394320 RepID=UPI0039FB9213